MLKILFGLWVCVGTLLSKQYYTASEFPGTQFSKPILQSDSSVAISNTKAKTPRKFTRHEQISLFPVMVNWDGFKRSFGGGVLYTYPLGLRHQFNLRLSRVQSETEQLSPNPSLTLWRSEAELRHYLHRRWYVSITAGMRRFKADARLQSLARIPATHNEGYGTISVGRRITEGFLDIPVPFSLKFSYSTEKDYDFGRTLPNGASRIEEGGFEIGLSVGF